MQCEITNDVATISFDDGKANVVGHSFIDGMLEGLERAKNEAKAVVITGRSGMFSAGFDLKELQKGPEEAEALVARGMDLLMRVYSHPQPVIAACDGHAIGMGAFLLLASDYRLGSDSQYNVTLPETAIGMTFTPLLMTLIHDRVSSRFQTMAVLQSKPFGGDEAVAAGFLDSVVAADALAGEAQGLAEVVGQLPAVYGANKEHLREESLAAMRESLKHKQLSV